MYGVLCMYKKLVYRDIGVRDSRFEGGRCQMVPEYYVCEKSQKDRIYNKIAQILTLICPNIANS